MTDVSAVVSLAQRRPSQPPRRRTLQQQQQQQPMMLLVVLLTVVLITKAGASGENPYHLNPDSVVLITGAAGLLGSELCLALHRTYHVKKIIAIDDMNVDKGGLTMGVSSGSSSTTTDTAAVDAETPNTSNTQQERLALFEFQRQRAFHVWQQVSDKLHFYRANVAPSLPEYFDVGEVPLLEYIFQEHKDITHVVHLQDATSSSNYMAVPRHKESIQAGLWESLLEQVVKLAEPQRPHVLYASSAHVYEPSLNNVSQKEDVPLSTPSSLYGASKILDEAIAHTYYETHQIYTIGLRFFEIYGPWGIPGSPLFEMAERSINPDSQILSSVEEVDHVRDYLYVSDAMDALLQAMQVSNEGIPLVVNVGSGQGTSLREIARLLQNLLPRSSEDLQVPPLDATTTPTTSKVTYSYANMERSQQVLGFQPRILLKEGLQKLLSWHYDRAFPYGGGLESHSSIQEQGIVSCSPYDKECLKGTPVFPCASECSHETQCTTSYYDDVLIVTRSLTAQCTTVLYTVELSADLEELPSAHLKGTTQQASFVSNDQGAHCNIAIVSESSPLVQRLKPLQGFGSTNTVVEEFLRQATLEKFSEKKKTLQHGPWTLVPVWRSNSFTTGDESLLSLLPKLSPGLFFSSKTTKYAVYADPHVIFKSIPSLLRQAQMQPSVEGETPMEGATALLVGRMDRPTQNAFGAPTGRQRRRPVVHPTIQESVQTAAYRMIRIGVIDDILGDGSHAMLDASWMVHRLQTEDSRLFRCDVLGEVVQWNVSAEDSALEFIMELHDMWSRVIVQSKGMEPWWTGDDVVTIPERRDDDENNNNKNGRLQGEPPMAVETERRRRLEEAPDVPEEEEEVEEAVVFDKQEAPEEEEEEEEAAEVAEEEEEEEAVVFDKEQAPEEEEETSAEEAEARSEEDAAAASDADGDEDGEPAGEGEVDVDNEGFLGEKNEEVDMGVVPEQEEQGQQDVEGSESEEAGRVEQGAISEESEEDDDTTENAVGEEQGGDADGRFVDGQESDRKVSSHDTWMGVLSSTSTVNFVRIVSSSEVGALYLDDFKY